MEYESNQFRDGGVEQAITLATELVELRRGPAGGTTAAIRDIARECRIGTAKLRQLVQPSRYPKDIGLGVWQRLRNGYLAYLRRELGRLEADIIRLERMGNIDPGTVQDLARETRDLSRRIKQHL